MALLSQLSLREVSNLIEQKKVKDVELFDKYIVSHDFQQKDVALVNSQNLIKLSLPFIHRNGYLKSFRAPGEANNNEQRPFNVNIVEILNLLLNPESRKKLLYLRVVGFKLNFPDGWIREIGAMLPSLEALDIDICSLKTEEFPDLCANFSNLKKLSIFETDVQKINGISKLKHLEVLNMSDIIFETKEDLEELGSLKKLRVLNISGQKLENMTTLQLFLECAHELPELRFVDIAQNVCTPEMLEKLVQAYPKLMKISLIGSTVELSEDIQNVMSANPNLQFMTVRTLKDCLRALDFYATTYSYMTIVHILESLHGILSKHYDDQLPSELKDCLALILEKFGTRILPKQACLIIVQCLNDLGRDGRFSTWDTAQKETAANFLLLCTQEEYRNKANREQIDDVLFETQCIAWKLLLQLLFDIPSQLFVDYVADHAIHTISASPEWNDSPVQISIFILSVCLDHASEIVLKFANKYHLLIQHVNRYLMVPYAMPPTPLLIQIIWLIRDLHKINPIKDEFVSKEVIETLMRCIEQARMVNNYTVQEHCFKALEALAMDCTEETLVETFHSYNLSIFLPLWRPQSTRQQLRLRSFALSLVLFARTDGKDNADYLFNDKENLAIEICVSIEKRQAEFSEATEPNEFWKLLESSMESENLVNWGHWVAKYCSYSQNSPLIPMQIIPSDRFSY